MEGMRNPPWSDLPPELLSMIGTRLHTRMDVLQFRSVCSSFRSSIPKVEVSFAGLEGKEEDVKSEVAATPLIVLRPWMIKQRMNLTKEQRGEVGEESKMESLQDEYIKAYYAALLKKQQEPEESSSRQVGVKAKRDPEDDVWEEAQYAGNAIERYKVGDLNVQADESSEDDDYVDWEEG